jgi:hypothetical protein
MSMKRGLVWVLCAVFALAGLARVVADEPAAKSEEKSPCCAKGEDCAKGECALKCPISGKKASKEVAVDYKGGKIYLCCPGCVAKFKENTAKYEAKANHQLVASGQFKQIGCPLSGGKVNPDTKIKVCGVEVGFCCNGCKGKVAKAAAEEQCEIVFVKGFEKAFALNKDKDSKESKESAKN